MVRRCALRFVKDARVRRFYRADNVERCYRPAMVIRLNDSDSDDKTGGTARPSGFGLGNDVSFIVDYKYRTFEKSCPRGLPTHANEQREGLTASCFSASLRLREVSR